jgi:hypothetical protein
MLQPGGGRLLNGGEQLPARQNSPSEHTDFAVTLDVQGHAEQLLADNLPLHAACCDFSVAEHVRFMQSSLIHHVSDCA